MKGLFKVWIALLATATIRFGRGPITTIPLVREDGEWKLASSPSNGAGER